MRKTTIIGSVMLATLVGLSAPASAQDEGSSGLGVGVETMLSSEFGIFSNIELPGAATVTYDSGQFYISGLLSFVNIDDNVTFLGVGGRFYYPVHRGDRSDFAVGGGLAITNADPNGPDNSDTVFHVEAGVRLRTWLTSNVALGAGLGLGIAIDDNDGNNNDDGFGLLGNLLGNVGITYYFW